jgi:hypothetical protein
MRTIRKTIYRAECAGCRTRATVAVAAGPESETAALVQMEHEHGWERRDYGNGLLLICPACTTAHPVLADCQIAGHAWNLVSDDQETSNLVCSRCDAGPTHRPVPDPAAAGRGPKLEPDPNAWWSWAGGGGIDTLEVIDHVLRELDEIREIGVS